MGRKVDSCWTTGLEQEQEDEPLGTVKRIPAVKRPKKDYGEVDYEALAHLRSGARADMLGY